MRIVTVALFFCLHAAQLLLVHSRERIANEFQYDDETDYNEFNLRPSRVNHDNRVGQPPKVTTQRPVERMKWGNDQTCGIDKVKEVEKKYRKKGVYQKRNEGSAMRIVGGRNTKLGEMPWFAQINMSEPGGAFYRQCGGSLINARYVLTAAHCVYANRTHDCSSKMFLRSPNEFIVTVGSGDHTQEIPVSSVTPHPRYIPSGVGLEHDLALLRLSDDAKLNDFVNAICLPLGSLEDEDFAKMDAEVIGYGGTEKAEPGLEDFSQPSKKPQLTKVTIQRNEDCRKNYNNVDFLRNLKDSDICAGGLSSIDACKGDSGGPLIMLDVCTKKYYVAGVVSSGHGCGQPWPAKYTRVTWHLDWIEQVVTTDT